MMAAITDREKVEILTLAEFTIKHSSDVYFQAAFTSAKKHSTRFNVDTDEVLVRVSPVDDVSQRAVPTSLRCRLPQPSRYSLMASHHGKQGVYDSRIKISTGPVWPMTSMMRCATAAHAH